MDLKNLADNIELRDGVWFARKALEVSYPREAAQCLSPIEENNFWFRHRNHCIAATLKNFYSQGWFADVGGGNGALAALLEKSGIPTVLVEPSREGIYRAQAAGVKNCVCSDLVGAGFRDASLSAIGAFDVLEHVKDERGFLACACRILAPGGLLFLTVPSFNALWSTDDVFSGHFRRYTSFGLHKTLEAAGFRTEYATYLFAVLPIPIFLFRTIPSRLGLRKNVSMQTIRSDSVRTHQWVSRFLGATLRWEVTRVAQRKQIPLGSTCLAVARKA